MDGNTCTLSHNLQMQAKQPISLLTFTALCTDCTVPSIHYNSRI